MAKKDQRLNAFQSTIEWSHSPPVTKDSATPKDKEPSMCHLMKSEKFTLDHTISGLMSSYRQTEIGHFEQFPAAPEACEVANNKDRSRCYIVNESGQEYYEGTWID